jgi:DNA-binding SARP family transcriptional activator
MLSGWDWFGAEGHRARLERAAEDAAVELVARCVARGRLDVAEAALRRARLVVPYSEALAERAMDLAAARGDLRGLRAAYEELGAIVEVLDPGGWPHEAAEARLGRLLAEAQASLAAMEAAPRSTSPSAPAAL